MTVEIAVLLILFIVLLVIGVPYTWALIFSCVVSLCLMHGNAFSQITSKMYAGGAKYTLLAIFFFMFAGAIMQYGGISTRLVEWAKALLGHVSGGLSVVVIFTCMIFAALTGSSIATTAAIGGMLYPELVKAKYPEGYAAALPVAGGTLGIVIPPSIVFVVYGTATGTSVSKLLISGIIPGVMTGIAMCIYAYIYAKRHKIPKSNDFSWKKLGSTTKDAIWAILMPVIILGGIYTGIFTPTESAAVAVIYGLLVSLLIYKELTMDRLRQIVIESIKSTANILLLIAAATVFGYVLTVYRVPTLFTELMSTVISSKFTFLLALNFLLLILGMLMDSGAIILIIAPLVYPLAMQYGVDAIQLGCIIVFNLAVGQATPPFGNCLFAAIPVTKQDIITLSKNVIPFVIIEFICVLLVSYIPQISLFLPNMMK